VAQTISVATRELAEDTIHLLIGSLSGQLNAFPDLVEGVQLSIAWEFLSNVQESFIMKARGEVGIDGIRWKPLSRKYLAYSRRFGTGEQAELKRAAGLVRTDKNGKATTAPFRFAPGGKKGLLTADQLKQWRRFYSVMLARMLASTDEAEAKRIAAGYAWNQMKKRGAQTKLNVYGSRQVEILRDTSVLFNSLSPFSMIDTDYVSEFSLLSTQNPRDAQILQTVRGGVRVGTSVPYAATHHYGDGRRGVPARPFWPEDLPVQWRENMADVLKRAVLSATVHALRRVAA